MLIGAAVLSALHLLALGIGLPGIVLRARALSRGDLAGALAADNAWGIAALLWLATGLLRAFGGFEKGTAFYLASPMFHLKMGLFLFAMLLELWPMITLIRWRIQQARGQTPDASQAEVLGIISWAEVGVIVLMPFTAALMARGFGFG